MKEALPNFVVIMLTLMTFESDVVALLRPEFSQSDSIHVEIITVGNIHPTSISSLPYAAPAMTVGLDELRRTFGTSVIFKHTLLYDVRYKYCNDLTDNVDRLVSEYYYGRRERYNMTVFIAPGCTERVSFAKLVRGWNHLMMIGGNGELVFRDNGLYPNVILAGKNAIKSYTDLFKRLFKKFKWRNIYIVLDSSAKPFHLLLAPNLKSALSQDGQFEVKYSRTTVASESDFDLSLQDLRATSRVVVFFGFAARFRTFMLKASRYGMTNGEYVYFACEPFRHRDYGDLTWSYGDRFDTEASQAFRSAFVVTASPEVSTNFLLIHNLNARFKELSKRDFNLTYGPNEEPNPFVTASYESFLLFGKILQEVLSRNYSHESIFNFLRNGSAVAELFSNRSFELPTGTIEFDEAGERKQSLDVKQFVGNSTEPRTILRLNGSAETFDGLEPIQWPTIWPPPNEPVCGFSGISGPCASPGFSSYSKSVIVSFVFVLLALTLGGYSVAYFRETLNMRKCFMKDWLLDPDILVFRDWHKTDSTEWTMEVARRVAVVVDKNKVVVR